MTMKHRHAFDRWVGKVQNDVNGAASRNIHGIEPCGRVDRRAILCIGQKMHLVYEERMQLGSSIENATMLVGTHASGGHRALLRSVLAPINIETVCVLREDDGKVRFSFLQRLHVDELMKGRSVIDGMNLPSRICIRFAA